MSQNVILSLLSDIVLNAKEIFKSSINEEKHKILKLILSNSQVNGKNLYFSINKPFYKLLVSKDFSNWYSTLSEYRAKHLADFKKLAQQI